MRFLYPFFDPKFFLFFSPLLVFCVTTNCFAKPQFRPWWFAIFSTLWLIFCLPLGGALLIGEMVMYAQGADGPDAVTSVAGGWLFSGLFIIWGQ